MTLTVARRLLTLAPEGAYAVLNKASQLEAAGKKIIHLEIGQPDFPTPDNIAQAGISAIKQGYTKYNPPLGILPLRQKIADTLNHKYQLNLSADNIAITPSGKTAIFTAMAALLNPGDEVIYPDPGFPTYRSLIDFFGAVGRPVPLLEACQFSFDMKVFKRYLSKKTKLVILNSPSNPTGGVIPAADLKQIADLTAQSHSFVITDEIYSNFVYDNQPYPSYYCQKNIQSRTILVDGFSKTYSMTGWRIGYLSAPASLVKRIDYLLTHSVGCTATPTQYAALAALTGPQQSVKAMVSQFEKRRNYLVAALNKIPRLRCLTPAGAFYVFPNIKAFKKSSNWLANYLLENAGVALLGGTAFGRYGEGYLRLSYATTLDILKQAVNKIKIALNRLP